MTFEEAIEIIEEVDGEVGAIGYIINKLQETYAPKIKMTKAQFDWLYQKQDLDIENLLSARWETPTIAEKGYTDSVRQIRDISDKTLVLAWLHPELIEVTNE